MIAPTAERMKINQKTNSMLTRWGFTWEYTPVWFEAVRRASHNATRARLKTIANTKFMNDKMPRKTVALI